MTTKVVRIQIIKPLDTDWNTLGKVFNDIQHETWRYVNKAMQMHWEYDGINYEYFKKFKESLNLEKNPFLDEDGKPFLTSKGKPFRNIENYSRNRLSYLTEKMNSYGVDATRKMVSDKWKVDKKKINYGEKSVANYKRDLPIEISSNQMYNNAKEKSPTFKVDERGFYSVDIRLISQKYAMELGRKGTETAFKLSIAVKDNYQKAIVNRVISGEYKMSSSKILRDRKGKWYLNLAYTFEPEKKDKLNPNNIMGVDVGVNVPAYLAVSHDGYYRQEVGDAREVYNFQKQMESRRRALQKSRKWAGDGSVGHGTKTRLKPLEKLSGKIARYKEHKNHVWSRYIVNEAVKNDCGVIQMEDLTGIADDTPFLKTWTYYQLQQMIEYKAKEQGIEVVKIKPNHTSARCNKCGNIHYKEDKEQWRPSQDQFKCMTCDWGHKFFVNADWNAALNIATKDIEKIIEEQLKVQEKVRNKHAS